MIRSGRYPWYQSDKTFFPSNNRMLSEAIHRARADIDRCEWEFQRVTIRPSYMPDENKELEVRKYTLNLLLAENEKLLWKEYIEYLTDLAKRHKESYAENLAPMSYKDWIGRR